MLKTTLMAIAMMTTATAAQAAVCADIPNPTRFNPTELSEYQECWLDNYEADVNAGILGSIAWVRLDGEYFSASLSQIRKNSGSYSEMFIAAIEGQLVEQIREDAQERVEELVIKVIDGGEYTDEQYLALKMELEEARAMAAAQSLAHAQAIETLTAAHNAALVAGKASAYGAGKAAMKAQLDAFYGDRIDRIEAAVGYTGSTFYGSDGLLQHLKNINWMASKYDGLKAQVASLQQVNLVQSQTNATLTAQVAAVNNMSDVAQPHSAPTINNAAVALSDDGTWDLLSYSDVETVLNAQAGSNNIVDVTVNNETRTFVKVGSSWVEANDQLDTKITAADSALNALSQSIKDKIGAKLDAAYAEGYSDGYNQGYTDGYADGVADTKAAMNG